MKVVAIALLFSTACCAQERFIFWSSEAALVASAVADHRSSERAIRRGGVETNPLGAITGSYASAGVTGIGSYFLYRKARGWQRLIPIALNIGMASWHFWAAKHNWGIK